MQKNDNLSFFSLGSQPVEMNLLPAMSPSVSRNVFFYSITRSQRGHAAGTTPWPVPLTASIPIRFPLVFQLLSQFGPHLSPCHCRAGSESNL